jgi:predicted RNA methylase
MEESSMELTVQGEYSHTPPQEADMISHIIMSYFPSLRTYPVIMDGTAGAGGNTLSFAKYFERVVAVEINKDEYKTLQHNVNKSGLKNIACTMGDFINERITYIPVIFLDPPWGGPNYKQLGKINLLLSEKDLTDILRPILSQHPPPVVALKVPYNVEDLSLRELTRELGIRMDVYEIWRKNRISYYLYVISNNFSNHPLRVQIGTRYSRNFFQDRGSDKVEKWRAIERAEK